MAILSRDGRVLEINSALSGIAGIGKDEARGRDCREIEPLSYLWNTITACLLHKEEQTEHISFGELKLDALVMPISVDGEIRQISIVLKDVSAFVELEQEFLKRNNELIIINTLTSAFISSNNLDLVYGDLLDKVLVISDLNIGWIVLREDASYVLKCEGGVSPEFEEKLRKGEVDEFHDKVVKSDNPLYVLESDSEELPDVMKKEGISFLACLPLKAGEDIVGILALASRMEVKFDFDLASLLSLVGNNLSVIAEKILFFQENQRLAVTDSLTDLYNVRYFYDLLEKEVGRTERYSTYFSLILFDIDNFKSFNDTYGHQAGDDILRCLAGILKKSFRVTDTVARYGGEEFIIILPNTDKEEAFKLARRVKEEVETYNCLEGQTVTVSLSGGVAGYPTDASDAKSLLYAADMAMYAAKAAGKKRVYVYEKERS